MTRKKARASLRPPRIAEAVVVAGLCVALSGCSFFGGGSDATVDVTPQVAGTTASRGSAVAKNAVVFTNENWTLAVQDADRYRGSAVDITGQIFYVVGTYEGAAHYQLFTDAIAHTGNTHLALPPEAPALSEGDTVHVKGTLDRMLVVPSRGGDELRLPYVSGTFVEVTSREGVRWSNEPVSTPTPEPSPTLESTAEPTAVIETPSPVAAEPVSTTSAAGTFTTTTTAASATTTSANTTIATGATSSPTVAGPFAAAVVAGDLKANANMRLNVDSNAPSGKYLSSDQSSRDWSGAGPLPTTSGAATLSVTVPSGGRYAVWVRAQYQNVDANSLWLVVDDQRAVLVGNEEGGYGAWRWVGWRDGNPNARVAVDLSAGLHNFTIADREARTRFDAVLVTQDLNYRPPDPPGGSAAPAGGGNSASTTTTTSNTTGSRGSAADGGQSAAQPTATPNASTSTTTSAATATSFTGAATATNSASQTPTNSASTSSAATTTTTQPTAAPTRTPSPAPTATTQPTPTPTRTPSPAPTPLPSPTPANQAQGGSYTVQSGDTLWAIAQRVYGDASQYQRIYAANRDKLSSPDRINPGMQLAIPR